MILYIFIYLLSYVNPGTKDNYLIVIINLYIESLKGYQSVLEVGVEWNSDIYWVVDKI